MTTATFTVTEPCVVADMPEGVYHADPVPGGSLSSGGARTLLKPGGPARFAYERHNPRTSSTKAFDLGHAAHTLVLGIGTGIHTVHAKDWKTKAAQEQRAEAYAAGQVPVLEADVDRVKAMVDAIRAHPLAGGMLHTGQAEQSAFWIDEATGVWCRARWDWTTTDRNGRLVIVDLKTCENAYDTAASRSTGNYGYHQQDDWYRRPARALGLDGDPGFVFIFVEKQPPHLVNVVQLDDEALEVARRRNDAALRIYDECTRTGVWPGYGHDIAQIGLPPYYPTQEY
jgi:hypothetical protein